MYMHKIYSDRNKTPLSGFSVDTKSSLRDSIPMSTLGQSGYRTWNLLKWRKGTSDSSCEDLSECASDET